MRVLVYGQCGNYGSGAWCYHEALKELTENVCTLDPRERLEHYQRPRSLYKVVRKLLGGGVLPWDRNHHAGHMLDFVRSAKPDIALVLGGHLLDGELIKELKREGVWVALINHDDFFSRHRTNRSKIRDAALSQYSHVFATKEVNIAELRHVNSNIDLLEFAYHPAIHHPPSANDDDSRKWAADIVFIGSCYPERAKQLEYLVARIPKSATLNIYGSYWQRIRRDSPLRPHVHFGPLVPEEMAKSIFYAKVSLGFLCKENRDDHTQRTFEIPACGGVLLAERTPRHLRFFREGHEAEFFESSDYAELVRKVNYLLDHDEYREDLRGRGNKAVLANHHTYKDRVSKILDVYQRSSGQSLSAAVRR